MVGNAIYLLFCKHLSDGHGGHVTLQTPHATFDGAREQMDAEREYWESVGAKVEPKDDGASFIVTWGQHIWHFYVVTRTIEK